jgi:peptidyl-prolyl cis-trans isomerase C
MRAHSGPRTPRRLVAAAALLLATGGTAGAQPGAEPAVPVAIVGGQTIGVADLAGYLSLRPAEGAGNVEAAALRRRLEEMIQADVLYQEALRLGIDREPAVRQAIRQIVVQRLVDREVEGPVAARTIGDDELKAYYESHRGDFNRPEQVRVADIFYAAPEAGDAALSKRQRARAEAALAEALALRDARFGFGELVLRDSETHPAYPRGDTGYFDREGRPVGVPAALAAAAFAIPRPGAIAAQVVATPEGFHVVMLTGRRDALARRLEEESVRAEIDGRIRAADRRQRMEGLFKALRERAEVRIEEPALQELAARLDAAAKGAARAPIAPAAGGTLEAPPAVPGAGR